MLREIAPNKCFVFNFFHKSRNSTCFSLIDHREQVRVFRFLLLLAPQLWARWNNPPAPLMTSDPHAGGKATWGITGWGGSVAPRHWKEHRVPAPPPSQQTYHLCKAKGIWLIRRPSVMHLLKALTVLLKGFTNQPLRYGTGLAHTVKISHRHCACWGHGSRAPEGKTAGSRGPGFLCSFARRRAH